MAQESVYYAVPYRDTAAREEAQQNAISTVLRKYKESNLSMPPRVRPLYYYDLQAAASGTSLWSNSEDVTLSADSSDTAGFPDNASMSVKVPTNNVMIIYGIADLSPNPVLMAWKLTIQDKVYPVLYLNPDLSTDENAAYVYPVAFRAIPPQTTFSLEFFGNGTGPDRIVMLGYVAELGTAPGE